MKKGLSLSQRRRLRSALARGKSARGTAEKLQCSRSTVRYWKARKTVKLCGQAEKRAILELKVKRFRISRSSEEVAAKVGCSARVVRDIRLKQRMNVRASRVDNRRKEALRVWKRLEQIGPWPVTKSEFNWYYH